MLEKKMIIHLVETSVPEHLLRDLLNVVQQYAAEELNRRAKA